MNGEQLDRLLSELTEWFGRQKRDLPWRVEFDSPPKRDPYRVWLSETMLQQTQVATVIPYFHRFLERFPEVSDLAGAPEEDVLHAWAGLGYYSRARNLQAGARAIVARGGFPETLEGWLEIPGVGPYTAGAVGSLAFSLYVPLVDGNVERVFARLFRLSRTELGERGYRERMWEIAGQGIERARERELSAGAVNEGWMELGATICTPRAPRCESCPLVSECGAFRTGEVERFPERKPRPEKIDVAETGVAVLDLERRRVLLADGSLRKWRKGLWDFPETVEGLEVPSSGATGASSELFPDADLTTRHVVTNHRIFRKTRVVRTDSRNFPAGAGMEWLSLESPERPLGSPARKILQRLRDRFPIV